jgi:uncharacterized DUF497 family protein
VAIREIESLFDGPLMLLPVEAHSTTETRFRAIGKVPGGRYIFLVFAIREIGGRSFIRPISARYMHRKEIEHYEKENPDL